MRKILFTLFVLYCGYWGATHQTQLEDYWKHIQSQYLGGGTAEEEEEVPEFVVEETPQPVLPNPSPASGPEPSSDPSQPAPLGNGIYYTRERITQVTDAGVSVINARVRVKKVGEVQGRLLVDDGTQQVLTTLSRLTNDPAEIAAMLEPSTPSSPSKDAPATKGSSTSRRIDPAVKAANAAKYRQYQIQIEEIGRNIGVSMSQVSILQAEAAAARGRGRPSTYNDRTIATLQQRIAALEAQRAKLRMEQAAIVRY